MFQVHFIQHCRLKYPGLLLYKLSIKYHHWFVISCFPVLFCSQDWLIHWLITFVDRKENALAYILIPAKSGITRALGIFVITIDILISQSIATPSGFMNRHCASGTYGVMRYQYTNIYRYIHINTLRPRQNGRHFADDTFKLIFLIENVKNSTKISLTFIPTSPINNIPALVHITAWRRSMS